MATSHGTWLTPPCGSMSRAMAGPVLVTMLMSRMASSSVATHAPMTAKNCGLVMG